ncbi:hypothetical protein LCGC14_1127690 [marine sediment metagenome]|uniref:Uncharacterized protein n=1 Tax=marine sediment metagenome TaxID=412755 RepID=A0A0F9Q7V2_9ZZZZ
MKKVKKTVIKITWRDCTSQHGWYSQQEAIEIHLESIQTIGWLVEENEDVVIIGVSLAEDGKIGNITIIPRGCILKMVKVQ